VFHDCRPEDYATPRRKSAAKACPHRISDGNGAMRQIRAWRRRGDVADLIAEAAATLR
jgi:hypothetical protein